MQGATNVALASVKAMKIYSSSLKDESRAKMLNRLALFKKELFSARPTEPAMRNALNYAFAKLEHESDLISSLNKRLKEAEEHLANSNKKIAEIGSKKIKNGMIVFTHCHSSSVMEILKLAKKRGVKFEVHNTETRPKFQGRITAKELIDAGIPVTHYIDSAARLALKKADLMLIGADAVTTEGKIINKIGSELFAEIAEKHNIPVYSCTDSWKFDSETIFGYEEEIESRSPDEIWSRAPKKIKIVNLAFEKVNPNLITGIISELGVYPAEIFVDQVKRAYPWISASF